MNRSLMYSIFAAAAVAASPALADDGPARSQQRQGVENPVRKSTDGWLSLDDVRSRLTAQGYRIREIELDDGLYEVEARNAEGRKVELKIDPRSGKIVGRDD
ncbi:MAG: PepSY domain-containing protein [Hyphomicrobiaceae bacterium]